MKKSLMFKKTHVIAKQINSKVGNYSISFSIALKRVWKMVKDGRKRITKANISYIVYKLTTKPKKPYTGPKYIDGVPDWIISENFSEQEEQAIWNYTDNTRINRETEKAVLIQFNTAFGCLFTWCPKSVFKGLYFNN
ncbi:hypothetical protein [Lactobacillus acetotolerans]|jgi:lipopolysaccharide export LptBFGC system permease protein LptF|uniref:hypothetical protein n=1 Tax=Lactobacillus acetotolerans TaxID=1600 RepID=UPI00241EAF3F|nr:hypothetical protein [Lactobacillus acetotolerans]